MTNYKIVCLLFALAITSCINQKTPPNNKKGMENNNAAVDAIIIGHDARRCLCCGGFMVTFSNDPTPYKADYFQWRPAGQNSTFGINHSSQFPIKVKIKYQPVKSDCIASKGEISISELTLR